MISRFIPSSLFLLLASVWEHVKFMAFNLAWTIICKLGTSLANFTTSIGKNLWNGGVPKLWVLTTQSFRMLLTSLSIHGKRNAGPEPLPEDMLLGIFQVEQFLRFRFDWKRWSKNTFWRRLCISGLLPKSNESWILKNSLMMENLRAVDLELFDFSFEKVSTFWGEKKAKSKQTKSNCKLSVSECPPMT